MPSSCCCCMIREAHNRQGSGAQSAATCERQCSRRRRTAQKCSAFASPAAKGYAAPPERTPHPSKPRRALTTLPKTAERDSRTEPPSRWTCRSRCSNEDTGNAAQAEADQAREPTAAEDAELGRASRSDHRTDAQTSRADEAATVRHNRQGSGAQTAPSCERANVDAERRSSAKALGLCVARSQGLCRCAK